MRTSRSKSLITGVTLGEAAINFLLPGIPPITASFALVREDGALAGRVEKRMEWSEKTMKALDDLKDAMEGDMLDGLFEPQPQGSSNGTEPEQV